MNTCGKTVSLRISGPVHVTREEFKNATTTAHFGFVLEENSSGKSRLSCREAVDFEKFCFQNVFRLHKNKKSVFINSFIFKSVIEKLRFHDELVWTVGPTVEIKLRGRCLNRTV